MPSVHEVCVQLFCSSCTSALDGLGGPNSDDGKKYNNKGNQVSKHFLQLGHPADLVMSQIGLWAAAFQVGQPVKAVNALLCQHHVPACINITAYVCGHAAG